MSEVKLTLEDTDPLYRQIYRDIERKISSGEIGFMEQLPALPELCRIYGVSEAPVRRALDELARGGFIVKRRGRGQGTFAIKRLTPVTVRVLLVGDFDLQRSAIEAVHEVFDLLAGIRDGTRERGCTLQQVSVTGLDSLPSGPEIGYLIIAMNWAGYQEGARLVGRYQSPFLLVNAPRDGYDCVRVDMAQGAYLAVQYLLSLGHRRIAYVGSTEGPWFQPRLDSYRRALSEAGQEFDPDLVQETDGVHAEQDERALDALLALPEPPTALFACSDYRALHLLNYCKQINISVPEQLTIVGYDDISDAANVAPALTTIRHPRYEQGKIAVDLLTEAINRQGRDKGEAPLDYVLPPELIIRSSATSPTI